MRATARLALAGLVPKASIRQQGCESAGGTANKSAPVARASRMCRSTPQDYEKRCEATFHRWPHYFPMPILQRAGAARPPSSASWWVPSSSRGPSPTPSRQSRSWKAALRPRCSWREFDLAKLGTMQRCGKICHTAGTSQHSGRPLADRRQCFVLAHLRSCVTPVGGPVIAVVRTKYAPPEFFAF